MFRTIIEIDESKCDGCGQCVTDCAEGALSIVDGKARLVSDSYCDGLGACLNCPQGALRLVQREAEAFDAKAAAEAVAKASASQISSLSRLSGHNGHGKPVGHCPGGSSPTALARLGNLDGRKDHDFPDGQVLAKLQGHMPVWPIQLRLMPPGALFLQNADILLAAHCSGFVLPAIQQDWITGRIPLIACPKLDPWPELESRLSAIVSQARPAKITILRMHVPCCGGLEKLARDVFAATGSSLPLSVHTIRPAGQG